MYYYVNNTVYGLKTNEPLNLAILNRTHVTYKPPLSIEEHPEVELLFTYCHSRKTMILTIYTSTSLQIALLQMQ